MAQLIVLFIALSMLACYKVPTLMICSFQLMVQSPEYLAVNTPPVLGYFDTKSWNTFLLFSYCSNGNPYLQLPDLPGETEKKPCILVKIPEGIKHSKEFHPEAASFSQNYPGQIGHLFKLSSLIHWETLSLSNLKCFQKKCWMLLSSPSD